MKRIENRCCHCAVPGYPCTDCGLRRYEAYYCDNPKCKEEIDGDVYYVDGKHLCEECLKKEFKMEV
jgi:hypothetical protein